MLMPNCKYSGNRTTRRLAGPVVGRRGLGNFGDGNPWDIIGGVVKTIVGGANMLVNPGSVTVSSQQYQQQMMANMQAQTQLMQEKQTNTLLLVGLGAAVLIGGIALTKKGGL